MVAIHISANTQFVTAEMALTLCLLQKVVQCHNEYLASKSLDTGQWPNEMFYKTDGNQF